MANNYCSVPKDWANLSSDLLPLIAHKLGDIIDFIRFRAVCKQWRLATILSDNPPQFPWIMMLKLDRTRKISFHALPSGKIFSGPSLDYIKITCLHQRFNEFMILEKDEKDSSRLGNKLPTHVFPLTINHFGCNVISGRDQVIPLPVPIGNISKFLYSALSSKMTHLIVVVHLGKIFAHYRGRNFRFITTRPKIAVDVCDGRTGKVLSTISCPVDVMAGSCLISTSDGLLLVSKKYVRFHEDDKPYNDYQFVVYRLENYDNNHPNWTLLNGIGDMMLFLDDRNAFSLMASEYDNEYNGNCIYFITRLKKTCSHFNSLSRFIVVGFGYDMGGNRSFEVCSLGEYTYCTELFWFIPSLV